jgi:hypothetical protein
MLRKTHAGDLNMPPITSVSNLTVAIPTNQNDIDITFVDVPTPPERSVVADPGTPYVLLSSDDFEPAFSVEMQQRNSLKNIARSVDVRWSLFRLLEKSDKDLATACLTMKADELRRLGTNFVNLPKEDLATFSKEQMTRLTQVFVPNCPDLTKEQIDTLTAKLS